MTTPLDARLTSVPAGPEHAARLPTVACEVIGGADHQVHPFASARRTSSCPSAPRIVNGFSISTCRPRSSAALPCALVQRRFRADHDRLQAVDRQRFIRRRAGLRHAEVAGDALRPLPVVMLNRYQVGLPHQPAPITAHFTGSMRASIGPAARPPNRPVGEAQKLLS